MWVVIIISVIALVLLSIYLIKIRKRFLEYSKRLHNFQLPTLKHDAKLKEELVIQINKYNNTDYVVDNLKQNSRQLPFPIPAEPLQNQTIKVIAENLTKTFAERGVAFVGMEQFLLMVLPPEKVTECLIFATETVFEHGTDAMSESFISVKASLLEGVVNIQDPEIIKECFEHFCSAILDYFKEAENVSDFINALESGGVRAAFLQIITADTVFQTLNPAFNFTEHLDAIQDTWAHHLHETTYSIGNHVYHTIIPSPTFHIPIITIIKSSIRELDLLADEKTEVETSVKNIALDVVGTGGGAFLGAKAGFLAGSFFPGVGNLVGGIIGAIGGAMGGRFLTNSIKEIPLQTAIENYKNSFDSMLSDLALFLSQSALEIRDYSINEKKRFHESINNMPHFDAAKPELVMIANELANAQLDDIKTQRLNIQPFTKSIFSFTFKNRAKLKKIKGVLNSMEKAIPNRDLINLKPHEAMKLIREFHYFENRRFGAELKISTVFLNKKNADFYKVLMMWLVKSKSEYDTSISKINSLLKEKIEEYGKKSESWKYKLNSYRNTINIEKAKLGH